jgi:hypothetical protein
MPKMIEHIYIVCSSNWLEEKLSFTTKFCNKQMSFEIIFQLQLTFFGRQICFLQWWEKCETMFLTIGFLTHQILNIVESQIET